MTSTSKDAQINELQAIVRKLESDAEKREKRMADLEAALQNRPLGARLEAAKEHGPTEELVRQVAELTATVKQLQANLKAKDSIIAPKAAVDPEEFHERRRNPANPTEHLFQCQQQRQLPDDHPGPHSTVAE